MGELTREPHETFLRVAIESPRRHRARAVPPTPIPIGCRSAHVRPPPPLRRRVIEIVAVADHVHDHDHDHDHDHVNEHVRARSRRRARPVIVDVDVVVDLDVNGDGDVDAGITGIRKRTQDRTRGNGSNILRTFGFRFSPCGAFPDNSLDLGASAPIPIGCRRAEIESIRIEHGIRSAREGPKARGCAGG
jgi:hypothetical protein